MRLEQVGLKRQGSARFLDGKINGVELLHAGFDAQGKDVGKNSMRQAAVLIELDGAPGVGFAIQVFFLEAFRPTGEGIGIRLGIVEQDGVLRVDLGLHQLIGVDLQA